MKDQTKKSLSLEDILVDRDITKNDSSTEITTTKNDEKKMQAQDYTVDGPKPKCDGRD